MAIHAYLQKSIGKSEATGANETLAKFAGERNWAIATTGVESEGGATHNCPGLFHLLAVCKPGDILLIAQVDRLTRLNIETWDRLRTEINARGVLLVSPDLPTTWAFGSPEPSEIAGLVNQAINSTLLDVLSTLARKAQEDKRWLQRQGIAATKAAGGYRGRPENTRRNDEIIAMLRSGRTWESVRNKVRCSNSTIARMAKRMKTESAEE
ncbi:recombinase family protein [Rhizobium tumorigenes]|uniref:recombinase family protein n=1 Tax=Rhizobium tumorigenes TaxID=2041385 RepID=UPI00241F58BE|nr:recombinase family protein [Rhizobium tumorigenes]WFS03334.1 recombinase family protein [Rhizobium tumorigenes]